MTVNYLRHRSKRKEFEDKDTLEDDLVDGSDVEIDGNCMMMMVP